MDFVNFWRRSITLSAEQTAVALDLPDGSYRLTVERAAPDIAPEIVGAVVVSGAATLTRALEGTTAREWPAGSEVLCSITAESLAGLFSTLADLAQRVAALEGGGVPAGTLLDQNGNALTDMAGDFLVLGG